jgi:transcriptional regulator with XRE-family HTH domain
MAREGWGAVLRKARARRKLTQAELARRAGIHQVTVARLENGTHRPSMDTLQRLAKALRVKVAELLSD